MESQLPLVPGYTLLERVGSGTYATVYKAFQNSEVPRDIVAVKCIDKQKIRSKKASDNQFEEIRLLKNLRHRHIVQMRDFLWDNRHIYIVLEYCAGGDLSKFIRQHRCLPEVIARKFLQQLALALEYLHSKNVAHLDLKPQNIFLSSRLPPVILKLGDFGFAQVIRPEKGSTDFRGSPLYMAPEIYAGDSYDAGVDLWSIGVILYECLFGRAPFASSSMEELLLQISSADPVIIPNSVTLPGGDGKRPASAAANCQQLSSDCVALLKGLLQKNPKKRMKHVEFFNHPFVDLIHAPSEKSIPTGDSVSARAFDAYCRRQNYEAFRLYCEAIDHYIAGLQVVESADERQQLREKIKGLIGRAEGLKISLTPGKARGRRHASGGDPVAQERETQVVQMNIEESPPSPRVVDSKSDLSAIVQMYPDVPEVAAAFTVAEGAKSLESRMKFQEALDKLQLAIDSTLRVFQKEPKESQRRVELKAVIEDWLSWAELLTQYVKNVETVNLDSKEKIGMEALKVEEATENLAKDQTCLVQ